MTRVITFQEATERLEQGQQVLVIVPVGLAGGLEKRCWGADYHKPTETEQVLCLQKNNRDGRIEFKGDNGYFFELPGVLLARWAVSCRWLDKEPPIEISRWVRKSNPPPYVWFPPEGDAPMIAIPEELRGRVVVVEFQSWGS